MKKNRVVLFRAIALLSAFFTAICLVELYFVFMEWNKNRHNLRTGDGGYWIIDKYLGFKPKPGSFYQKTHEFECTGNVNQSFANERPIDFFTENKDPVVLCLGDSHTFATGVSQAECWPRILETLLRQEGNSLRVYNGACTGYSLHQYKVRLEGFLQQIKPSYVVVGFSMATDLYDLIPPSRGGWIYGSQFPERDYWDFSEEGKIIRKHFVPMDTDIKGEEKTKTVQYSQSLRTFLSNFATVRYLWRSNIALWLGSKLRPGGQSLWPGVEMGIEKEISDPYRYNWNLTLALLESLNNDCKKNNAKLIIFTIPYLPQVYDEIWSITFGNNPKFKQDAGIQRIKGFCHDKNILFCDSTPFLRTETQKTGKWLHFREDAHPTSEGHRIIAESLNQSGLIK